MCVYVSFPCIKHIFWSSFGNALDELLLFCYTENKNGMLFCERNKKATMWYFTTVNVPISPER